MKRSRFITGFRQFAAPAAGLFCACACAAASPVLFVPMRAVPGDVASGGPDYAVHVGTYEITNAQFVAFLNDALANRTNERGHYMFHATNTGNVYVHSALNGATGNDAGGTFLFNAGAGGRIAYANGAYALVDAAYADHPVVGVSWYGAVKFCNWMTIQSGQPIAQRAYGEGPSSDLNLWRPITITSTNWAVRDLNDAERDALLALRGYRLPMDDGVSGTSDYNEWRQAAAWLPGAMMHAAFGFGRDVVSGADANYFASGDPFAEGTTPVGYYNGTNHGGSFSTNDTDNAYGLYDCSGNVWEWVQDQTANPLNRGIRGGSWQSAVCQGCTTLRTDSRSSQPATGATQSIGFRIARAVPGRVRLWPENGLSASGRYGGPYTGTASQVYSIINTSSDLITLNVTPNAPWLAVDGASDPLMLMLDPDETVDVTVEIAAVCDPLVHAPGTYNSTVSFFEQGAAIGWVVTAAVTVTEPLSVAPAGNFATVAVLGEALDDVDMVYTISSASNATVDWEVVTDQPWVLVNDQPADEQPVSGTIAALGQQAVTLTLDAASLPVGEYAATVTFRDLCTGITFTRSVDVDILPSLHADPPADPVITGVFPMTEFAVVSDAPHPIDWEVTTDDEPALLLLNGGAVATGQALAVLGEAPIEVTLSADAMALPTGEYDITLRFRDVTQPDNVYETESVATLSIAGLIAAGPVGGPFVPPSRAFTMYNHSAGEMPWRLRFEPPDDVPWIELNSGKTTGTLLPGDALDIGVAITPQADALDAGSYQAVVAFENLLTGDVSTREVSLNVAIGFSVNMAHVAPDVMQPAGPTHLFRIGKYEITNREYVAFLNDAYLHPNDGRGAFMYHDTDSGDVFLHDNATGVAGTDGTGTMLFDASLGGAIVFDENLSRYTATTGGAGLPVVGVTWLGAVKYCNWLTLAQGMDAALRCYVEGPMTSDWQPAADADTLLNTFAGYRLPMDGGLTTAGLHNEWYLAAAWDSAAMVNRTYGFGRNVLTQTDANYLNSGDPYDTFSPPLSPVGYFNGFNLLADGETVTANTANAFGLYDLSGNAAEWLHDDGPNANRKAVRGGSALNAVGSAQLRTNIRTEQPVNAALAYLGFRAAQSLEPAAALEIDPAETIQFVSGRRPGPLAPDELTYTLVNPSVGSIEWSVTKNVSWIDVNGSANASGILGGNTQIAVAITINDSANDLPDPPAPAYADALIAADDPQPGGPMHAFSIATFEVTNADYVLFLNDALATLDTERGAYLYFDTDSGDVYIHDDETGAAGEDGAGVRLFEPAAAGRIMFDGEVYVVADSYADHPVAGVSWYGAVKYCNWLTVADGNDPSLRAYAEGPDAASWQPASDDAATFATRALGYRLPMDNGAGGADPFNEWHRAAAWNGCLQESNVYGFGPSDTLTGADANYAASGDAFDDGTTPVGYYDGTLYDPVDPGCDGEIIGFITNANANPAGLFDVTGNVAEWVSDVDGGGIGATRGGSYLGAQAADALTNDVRTPRDATQTVGDVGFRVAHSAHAHIAALTFTDITSGVVQSRFIALRLTDALEVVPASCMHASGPFRGPFDPASWMLTLTNESDAMIEWSIDADASWVEFDGDDMASGMLAPGAMTDVAIQLADSAADRVPGVYPITVTIVNETTGRSRIRQLELTVEPALGVEPADAFEPMGAWDESLVTPENERVYSIENLSGVTLDYAVTANVNWLDIDGGTIAAGEIASGEIVDVTVSVNAQADALNVGDHDATVTIGFDDNGVGASMPRDVTLHVLDLLSIDPPCDTVRDYSPDGVPENIPPVAFTLTNVSDSLQVAWEATVDQDWLLIDGLAVVSGDLDAGQGVILQATFTESVAALGEGQHVATILFHDFLTGYVAARTVTLNIDEDLGVAPVDGLAGYGVVGGLVAPYRTTYTLINLGDDPVDWTADAVDAWVTVSPESGTLAPLETADVRVAIDLFNLPPECLESACGLSSEVQFRKDGGTSLVARRPVTVELSDPALTLTSSLVPGADNEPAGPTYDYRVAATPITNAAFAVFLNDALNQTGHARGFHMYHDTDTGDVYVNSTQIGAAGTDGSEELNTAMFTVAGNLSRITFDGGQYVVTADFENHPVTGVTWYGALKFCNWLTIDQGLGLPLRCYGEGTAGDLSAWRPTTIDATTWASRDLIDAERLALVSQFAGYRLPMDDGSGNANPTNDSADAYNEWYKAAAWDPILRVHRVYGFGRNTTTGADANYQNSGDPFDNGTTPVGYYDGTNHGGAFATNANANGYNLFDLSGNVAEWVQDHYSSPAFRAVRGGSWDSNPAHEVFIRNTRRESAPPNLSWREIGFRVMRVTVTGDADRDGDVDLADVALFEFCMAGVGGPLLGGCQVFDMDGDGDVDLADFAFFVHLLR